DHVVGSADLHAAGNRISGVDVLGLPPTDLGRQDPRTHRSLTEMMRRHLIASACCGVIITGTAIACAVLVAHILAGLVTQPHSRTLSHWSLALAVLSALWMARVIAQWTQARLSQRGATAAIADLSHRLLTN